MERRVSTLELRIDYLRPGRLETLVAEGVVARVVRSVGVADIRIHHRSAPKDTRRSAAGDTGRLREAAARRRQAAWTRWAEAHATNVETEPEAAQSLRLAPLDQPLPRERWQTPLLALGNRPVYGLTGKSAEALPLLLRAARRCGALVEPFVTTQAQLYPGMAREATGDKAGAAAAYQAVLKRWGRARPRSLTAERARAWLAALPQQTPGDRRSGAKPCARARSVSLARAFAGSTRRAPSASPASTGTRPRRRGGSDRGPRASPALSGR
jgi:Thioesterase superfamily